MKPAATRHAAHVNHTVGMMMMKLGFMTSGVDLRRPSRNRRDLMQATSGSSDA
jgi:hypothetical protein